MQFDKLTYVYTCEIITKIKMTLQVSLYSCVNSLPRSSYASYTGNHWSVF